MYCFLPGIISRQKKVKAREIVVLSFYQYKEAIKKFLRNLTPVKIGLRL